MMARRGMIRLLLGGFSVLLGGCGLLGGNSYRFRMTVEVDTPQGLRTGSSVYEVRARNLVGLTPEMADRQRSLKGEAVAVDLPGGKTLFALLKTVNSQRDDLTLMSMAALDPAFRNDWVECAQRIAWGYGIRSPAEVPQSDYPLLVTFHDTTDPKSVERVEPTSLAATLGPGYALRRITVEVTDKAVTTGIVKRLGWLGEYPEPRLDNNFKPTPTPTFAQKLRHGDFRRTTAQ